MEYLLVRFDQRRRVVVNGLRNGFTNSILQLESGSYEITLEPPPDFSPLSQSVRLQNTAAMDPYQVTFHRLPPAAIPPAPGAPP
jgi:hypothetical protein